MYMYCILVHLQVHIRYVHVSILYSVQCAGADTVSFSRVFRSVNSYSTVQAGTGLAVGWSEPVHR